MAGPSQERKGRWWDYLRSLRLEMGLTIRAVARESHRLAATREQALTDSYLSQLERGKARNPSLLKLVMLARIYREPFPSMLEQLTKAGFSTAQVGRFAAAAHALTASKGSYSIAPGILILSSSEASKREIIDLMEKDRIFLGLASLLAKAYAGTSRERRDAERLLMAEIITLQDPHLHKQPPFVRYFLSRRGRAMPRRSGR